MTAPGPLSSVFLAALPAAARDAAERADDLEARLGQAVAAARTAVGVVIGVHDRDLVAYVAARTPVPEQLQVVLTGERWSDLLLACGSVQGDSRAAAAVKRTFGPKLRAALAKSRIDAAVIDDVEQTVFERILVAAPGARPKIAEYDGSGSLASWLRVVAVREALHVVRRDRREIPLGAELAAVDVGGSDPELDYFKAHYRAEYREAFAAAADALTPEQRALLRQHFLQGLTVDQLGALHGIHRASASRRVSAAREELFANTRRELVTRLGISREEIARILELIQSRLDLSLGQVLGR